jgi:1,4-dihydroxy-2-naphthoyl-CoA synthase
MKADLTRSTDRPDQHYRAVRMQQGRVQLDAEWNEQQEILNRRIETETLDSLGAGAAVPIDHAGFLLTGAGKMFCAGGDIGVMASSGEKVGAVIGELASTLHLAMSRLARMNKPLINLINGAAAGAGYGLALSGDVVLAARVFSRDHLELGCQLLEA